MQIGDNLVNNDCIIDQYSSVRNGQESRRILFDIQDHNLLAHKCKPDDESILEQNFTNNQQQQIFSPQNCQQETLINKSNQILELPKKDINQIPSQQLAEIQQIQLIHNDQRSDGNQLQLPNNLMNKQSENNNIQQLDLVNKDSKKLKFNIVWQQHALTIVQVILSFIKLLKSKSSHIKFRMISLNQLTIIDDASAHYNYWRFLGILNLDQPTKYEITKRRVSKYFKFIVDPLNKLLKQLQVILPDSFVLFMWELALLIVLVLNIFYVPIQQVFRNNYINKNNSIQKTFLESFIFIYLPGTMVFIDILLQFNRAIFIEGQLIVQRRKIIHYYFLGSFFLDVTSLLPFVINECIFKEEFYFLNYLLFLRLLKIQRLFIGFEEMMFQNEKRTAIKELIKLISKILFVANLISSAFFLIAEIEKQQGVEKTWLDDKNLYSNEWFNNYINSLYWAVITMLTIGYGDLYPITYLEKLYVIAVSFIACGVFAYSFNVIGTIIQGLNKQNKEYKAQLVKITNFLKQRNVNQQLQFKVRKYFEYLNQENQEDNCYSEDLLKFLNGSLQKEVLTDLYLQILKSKKLFKLNFSHKFLVHLAPKLKEKRFTPEELIYHENSSERQIYFILKGKVKLFIGNNSNPNLKLKYTDNNPLINKKIQLHSNIQQGGSQRITQLSVGDIFGEYQFFTGLQSQTASQTENIVTVAYLTFEDFISTIQQFPEDQEKYCFIKDNIIFYNNTQGTGIKCSSCKEYSHTFNKCPFLAYHPNQYKVLNIHLKSEEIKERKLFKRREHKTDTPLIYMDLLQDSAIQHLAENNPFENLQQLMDCIEKIQGQGSNYEANEHQSQLQQLATMNQFNTTIFHNEDVNKMTGSQQKITELRTKKKKNSDKQTKQLKDEHNLSNQSLKSRKSSSSSQSSSQSSQSSSSSQSPKNSPEKKSQNRDRILDYEELNPQTKIQIHNKLDPIVKQESTICSNNDKVTEEQSHYLQPQQTKTIARRCSIFKKESNQVFISDPAGLKKQGNEQTASINSKQQLPLHQFTRFRSILNDFDNIDNKDDMQSKVQQYQRIKKLEIQQLDLFFEKLKLFTIYFPKNNYDIVIKRIQEKQENFSVYKRQKEKLKSIIINRRSFQLQNKNKKNSIYQQKGTSAGISQFIQQNQTNLPLNQKSQLKQDISFIQECQDNIDNQQQTKMKDISIIN